MAILSCIVSRVVCKFLLVISPEDCVSKFVRVLGECGRRPAGRSGGFCVSASQSRLMFKLAVVGGATHQTIGATLHSALHLFYLLCTTFSLYFQTSHLPLISNLTFYFDRVSAHHGILSLLLSETFCHAS